MVLLVCWMFVRVLVEKNCPKLFTIVPSNQGRLTGWRKLPFGIWHLKKQKLRKCEKVESHSVNFRKVKNLNITLFYSFLSAPSVLFKVKCMLIIYYQTVSFWIQCFSVFELSSFSYWGLHYFYWSCHQFSTGFMAFQQSSRKETHNLTMYPFLYICNGFPLPTVPRTMLQRWLN